MKEDLGMYGNQLVTSVSIWTVGYVVGQVSVQDPGSGALTRADTFEPPPHPCAAEMDHTHGMF